MFRAVRQLLGRFRPAPPGVRDPDPKERWRRRWFPYSKQPVRDCDRPIVPVPIDGDDPIAIVSCVHGNLPALNVVTRFLADRGIGPERTIHLGDAVGYGPDPVPCLDHAMRCAVMLRGNHEEAVFFGAWGFCNRAKQAIDYSRYMLGCGRGRPDADVRRRWEFLREIPLQAEWRGIRFVHGSPRLPTLEYILKVDVDYERAATTAADPEWMSDKMREIFGMFDRVLVVGHSHTPALIGSDLSYRTPDELDGAFVLPDPSEDDRRWIINVGSVGQPRDQDVRACCVTFDPRERTFRWHRLDYPIEDVASRIASIPALHESNAERLRRGV